ncbi:MAG: metallophosphoesterase family protein [Actinomycetales bacterium]|nr:metallophosphoesterase family protein [Actinomycetales bacterium]
MRVHIASDVHGAWPELRQAAEGADLFVCLGDLILFLDYADPSRGIYADLFGETHTRAYIAARTAGRFEDARSLSAAAWERIGVLDPQERWARLQERVAGQYEEAFAAMPDHAVLTYGNVDVPGLWPSYARPTHRVLDAVAVELGGMRMGFVGGGLVSPMRTPYEVTEEEYQAKLDAIGDVDILFTHIPPRLPELTYDVIARRFEVGSAGLAEYVRRAQPRYHFFGHVHQPHRARSRIGRTECVNVGHFQARGRPFAIDL